MDGQIQHIQNLMAYLESKAEMQDFENADEFIVVVRSEYGGHSSYSGPYPDYIEACKAAERIAASHEEDYDFHLKAHVAPLFHDEAAEL